MKLVKKLILSAFCLAAALSLFPAGVSASETVLDVKWNYGYVGSMGNALGNENKLGSVGNTGTSYRYTDVVLIEKAGTTVWFTEYGSGNDGFCSRTGYSISSWKKSGSDFVIDTLWANYPGTDGVTAGIATRSGNTVTYMYTTGRDNEYLRFCFCITGDTDKNGKVIFPTVYSAYTQNPGTFIDGCAVDTAAVSFNVDGTVGGFLWFDGYVGSDRNDIFYVNEIRPYFAEYSYTGIITVPRAGTTLSFTDAAYPYSDLTVYAVSSWKPAGMTWVLDSAGANHRGIDNAVVSTDGNSKIYTYTTTKNNENLRFCVRTNYDASTLPVIYWSAPDIPVAEGSGETSSPVPDTPGPQKPETSHPSSDASGGGNGRLIGISLLSFTGAAYIAGFSADRYISRSSSSKNKFEN